MARVQIFDDGTKLFYDDDGNVLAATDLNGEAISPPAASPVIKQFAELFNYGVAAVIGRIREQIGPIRPAPVPPAQQQQKQLMSLALLGLGAFVIYKLAT